MSTIQTNEVESTTVEGVNELTEAQQKEKRYEELAQHMTTLRREYTRLKAENQEEPEGSAIQHKLESINDRLVEFKREAVKLYKDIQEVYGQDYVPKFLVTGVTTL